MVVCGFEYEKNLVPINYQGIPKDSWNYFSFNELTFVTSF